MVRALCVLPKCVTNSSPRANTRYGGVVQRHSFRYAQPGRVEEYHQEFLEAVVPYLRRDGAGGVRPFLRFLFCFPKYKLQVGLRLPGAQCDSSFLFSGECPKKSRIARPSYTFVLRGGHCPGALSN